VGTEFSSSFYTSALYNIINGRLMAEKPTIISTNLNSADLRKSYNDRITSRLMGEYALFPFYGTDIRKQKIQKK
jgi:DNA replication protein DnaC